MRAASRITEGEPVLKGRSCCDKCGHALNFLDLVPIASYLARNGKCRYCGTRLSSGYVWAEIISGIVFVCVFATYGWSLQMLEMMCFASVLLASAFADLKSYIIPNRFVLAGVIARIPFFFCDPNWQASLIDSLLGGFAVGGGLLCVVLLYEKIRNIEAMGGGDLKLLFVTGLYLGWTCNILCLFLACIFGIVFALATQKSREGNENPKAFPWAPAISAAAIICALAGSNIYSAIGVVGF